MQRDTGSRIHADINRCRLNLCCKLIRILSIRPECGFLDADPRGILAFALVAAKNCHSILIIIEDRARIVVVRNALIAETSTIDNVVRCAALAENRGRNLFDRQICNIQKRHLGIDRADIVTAVCRDRQLTVCGVQLVILSSRYSGRERLPRLFVGIIDINAIAVRSVGLAVHLDQLVLAVAAVRPFAASPRLVLRYDNAVLQRNDRTKIGCIAGCFLALLIFAEIVNLTVRKERPRLAVVGSEITNRVGIAIVIGVAFGGRGQVTLVLGSDIGPYRTVVRGCKRFDLVQLVQPGNVAAGKGKASFFQRKQAAAVAHDQIELTGHVVHARSRHRDVTARILHIAQGVALAGIQDSSRQIIGSGFSLPCACVGGEIDRRRDLRHVVGDIVQTHLKIMIAGIQRTNNEFRASERLAFVHTVTGVKTYHKLCGIFFCQLARDGERQIADAAAVCDQVGVQARRLVLDDRRCDLSVIGVCFHIEIIELEYVQQRHIHLLEMRRECDVLLQLHIQRIVLAVPALIPKGFFI